jgi:hypothetical protein
MGVANRETSRDTYLPHPKIKEKSWIKPIQKQTEVMVVNLISKPLEILQHSPLSKAARLPTIRIL